MNGVFGEGSQRLHFLLVPGLRGREAPGRMLWEMPADGVHHPAARGTDPDAEGGASGSQGCPLRSPSASLLGDLFFKKEGAKFGSILTSFHTYF